MWYSILERYIRDIASEIKQQETLEGFKQKVKQFLASRALKQEKMRLYVDHTLLNSSCAYSSH